MPVHFAQQSRLSLRRLFPEAEFLGAADISVASCTADSRGVQPGALFAVLNGTTHNGRDFVDQAIARGCSAILADQPVLGTPVPVCVVPDAREAYGRLCQALAGDPSARLRVIGVTGTNGKTTTSCLIAGILAEAGFHLGILGTLGYSDGRWTAPSSHTTPPPEPLAHWLSRMAVNGCSHAVMEVSSHALDQARLAGVTLDCACMTNVRRDHLDYHPSLQHYRFTKAKILNYLSPEGFAVVNADDPVLRGLVCRIQGPALTVGIDFPAEITATLLEQCISEQMFLLTAGNETIAVRTRMIGRHHVSNCLAAAAVGLAYGIDLPTVVRGLESVEYVPGRLQRLECGQPFAVFVDYAHTPDALECVLDTLRRVTRGRLICVFGAGGDRDRQKRPLMGRTVEAGADRAYVTNDNPRTEDPQQIIREILAGFSNPEAAEVIPDRAEAICRALAVADAGDCVLIAGKGHENYQIVGDQRLEFDDAQVARDWLYDTGGVVWAIHNRQ